MKSCDLIVDFVTKNFSTYYQTSNAKFSVLSKVSPVTLREKISNKIDLLKIIKQ